MFDKKGPKQVTLCIGQLCDIGGYTIAFMGKMHDTLIFNCPGWTGQQLYISYNTTYFYAGNKKVTIIKATENDVTLGWEG
jgi:hypothetical protein